MAASAPVSLMATCCEPNVIGTLNIDGNWFPPCERAPTGAGEQAK